MSTAIPFLSTSPSPILSLLHLAVSSVALVFSVVLVILESRLRPRRPRLLLSASTPAPKSPPIRARCLISLFRLIVSLALLANILLAAFSLTRLFFRSPLSSLAPDRVFEIASSLISNAHSRFLRTSPNPVPDLPSFSSSLLSDDSRPTSGLLYPILIAAIGLIAAVGALISNIPSKMPFPRIIGSMIFVQTLTLVIAAAIGTFVFPSPLPYDSTHISSHWLDRTYADRFDFVNASRFLSNWYTKVSGEVISVDQIPNFKDSFCASWEDNIPRVGVEVELPDINVEEPNRPFTEAPPVTEPNPPPEEEEPEEEEPVDDDPVDEEAPEEEPDEDPADDSSEEDTDDDVVDTDGSATTAAPSTSQGLRPDARGARQVVDASLTFTEGASMDDLFLTFVVGKPSGFDDIYRVMAYVTLAALVGAPVVIAQAWKFWISTPFILLWAIMWFTLLVLGVPSILRVIAAPLEEVQTFEMCGLGYRTLVKDDGTRLRARLDMAFIAVTLLAGLVNGYRWMRYAEKELEEEEEREVKMVNYEEVYSGSGTLRW